MTLIETVLHDAKLAARSVFHNPKRHICFLLALLFLQCAFAVLIVQDFSIRDNQYEYLEDQYTNSQGYVYHLQLQGLNSQQYSIIRNYEITQSEEQQFFRIVGGSKIERTLATGSAFYIYDIDIAFVCDNIAEGYSVFSSAYYPELEDEGSFEEFVTPLLKYWLTEISDTVVGILLIAFIFAFGALMLWILHSIAVGDDRFTYGIYMTCGAGFKQLFAEGFWECLIKNLLVFPISGILFHIIAFLFTLNGDICFAIYPLEWLLSLLLSLAASLLVVFIDFRRVASSTPLKLIAAEDQSNLISSPRTSSHIISYNFSKEFETLSLWRYRKYVIKLLCFTAIFSALFVGGSYLANVYYESVNSPAAQYKLVFSPTVTVEEVENFDENGDVVKEKVEVTTYDFTYDDEIGNIVSSLDGIKLIEKECSVHASEIGSYIEFPADGLKNRVGGLTTDEYTAFYSLKYMALDNEVANMIETLGYKVEGNLQDVIDNSKTIAISDSYNNKSGLNLKVGDTVNIATIIGDDVEFEIPDIMIGADADNILKYVIENYRFKYTEYTVGAIISGMPSDGNISVYLGDVAYKKITGDNVRYTDVNIYVDTDIDSNTLEMLGINLRGCADYFSNLTVTDTDSLSLRKVEQNKCYIGIMIVVSLMFLSVTPLIWTLSQTLHYKKRHGELDTLCAIGADKSTITGIFKSDMIFYIPSALFLYVLLSLVLNVILYNLVNSPNLYRLFSGSDVIMRFNFSIPWIAFIIGAIITGVSAWISVRISMTGYLKSRFSEISENVIERG